MGAAWFRTLYKEGTVVGHLTVYEVVGKYNKERIYRCICDCGNEVEVKSSKLMHFKDPHCGCKTKENRIKSNNSRKKDFFPKGLRTTFADIKTRCYNPKSHTYNRYGKCGITICDEWKDDYYAFAQWAIDNGWKKGLTIDRIDNNKGYSPDNCRIATIIQQANNRRSNRYITVFGEEDTVANIARKYKIGYKLMLYHLDRGKSPNEIVERLRKDDGSVSA